MKSRNIVILFLVIVVLLTAFIFYNSSRNIEQTYKASDTVTEIVKPVVPKDVSEEKDTIDFIVRKAAHGIEFFVLGIAVSILTVYIKSKYTKMFFGSALFYILGISVIDEYIQKYTGRTSSVTDVLIDFFGGLIGFLLIFLIYIVYISVSNKKQQKH